MTYEHEENNMRTTIYRVKPIDKQKVIKDFWSGDVTRKKMAKELKEVFKF